MNHLDPTEAERIDWTARARKALSDAVTFDQLADEARERARSLPRHDPEYDTAIRAHEHYRQMAAEQELLSDTFKLRATAELQAVPA